MPRLPKIFLILTLPLYILDQVTKWWCVFRFSEPFPGYFGTSDARIEVIEGFLWWTRVHNQGVAFGFGNGTVWAPYVFLCVLIAAIVLVTVFWKKGAFPNTISRVAAALLVSGILGNLTDRLFQGFWLKAWESADFFTRLSKGYVVDFIDVTLPIYGRWPTFNVADSCISIAAVLLFISAFRPEEPKEEKSESEEPSPPYA